MSYYRPEKLHDALNWLQENRAGIVAGCTDLFAMCDRQYLEIAGHEAMLDITAIDGLAGIEHTNHGYRIGAATKWSALINSDLPPAFDGLKEAAREVGSVQIQNSGTIGGNLCNASPAADGVPPLLCLDAQVELVSSRATRHLPLREFLLGVRKTTLAEDEILSAIIVPDSACGGRSGFVKLGARKYLVISIAMVVVRLEIENNLISDVAISVGSCGAVASRMGAVEQSLIGKTVDVDLHKAITRHDIAAALSPIDDIRADKAYRLKAARELVVRCVRSLLRQGSAAS